MKNVWLIGTLVLAIVVAAAVFTAFYTGEKSKVIVAGKIRVAPHLQKQAQHIRILYIVLRDAQAMHPMPYGAYVDRTGNFSFMLTKDNIQLMGAGASAEPTTLNIKARLDKDGRAGIDQQGDLVGELTGIATGTTDVEIVINRAIQAE
ncbi:MAG: hypothetical protein OYH77_07920 [Pseudomonadota bacterium]|nr:hypothetical protein [Pseudomonadota bacterium]